MIKPKDGEWWMVELNSGDKRVMRYWLRDGDLDAVWNVFNDESDSFIRACSDVKPLHKMTKAEEKKTRTKVVYERVDDYLFKLRDDFDKGLLYGINSDGTYWKIATSHTLAAAYKDRELYRKVEREIDWKDELESYFDGVDYLSKSDMIKSAYNGDESENDEAWDSEFIGMCHLVASLTDKPE